MVDAVVQATTAWSEELFSSIKNPSHKGLGNFWMGHFGGVFFFDLLLSGGECTIFLRF